MFDRFIRLARAKKALKEGRFLDALQQSIDPEIQADRRAEHIRQQATDQLLKRVRARLVAGEVVIAQQEVKRLSRLASSEAVDEMVLVVSQAANKLMAAADATNQLNKDFRQLVDAGDLSAAETLLASHGKDSGATKGLSELLTARRAQAMQVLDRAIEDAGDGSAVAALDGYRQALAMDSGLPEAARVGALRKFAGAAVAHVEFDGGVASATTAQLSEKLAAYALLVTKVPELVQQPAVRALQAQLVEAVERGFSSLDEIDPAIDLARAVTAVDIPIKSELDAAIAALLTIAQDQAMKSRAVVLAQLQVDLHLAGCPALSGAAAARLTSVANSEEQFELARSLLEQGKLEAARAMFVAFLKEHPMHEAAQKELELVDQGMADMDRGLADVRLALRAGRLREACTTAMALVGVARIAAEAQQMLAEARSRMALVEKGLDEVRVQLHGRAAATREGVAHSLKRLEELAKVQVDHDDLPQVIQAVTAEIDALDLCEKAAASLSGADLEAVSNSVTELIVKREELLAAERIDAKLCQIGDGIIQLGDRAMADGRLAVLLRCCALMEQLEPVRGDFLTRSREWRETHKQREAEVGKLLLSARECLADRNLVEAERLVGEARKLWRESAEAQAFGHQLQKLRNQTQTLDQVAAMAEEKDFLGAHQKLAEMPGVPPMLRTRVYDMKQDLARAQGLEGAFMLRVDEGGEQLVLRGESVSIGNVRKACADLPVLANLAGRHATIRRSMSFHGGMQDSVVSEEGEVQVGGKKVKSQILKSGDRVKFGDALSMLYQRPTPRSLTSRLLLQGGFQVAGTDRVLLMKDRGRDGRILIGPGRESHVTVAKASGEVEIYANKSGQMRIFCEQGGAIDGTVFQGEHPVAAGQVIEACGITFLLLPSEGLL